MIERSPVVQNAAELLGRRPSNSETLGEDVLAVILRKQATVSALTSVLSDGRTSFIHTSTSNLQNKIGAGVHGDVHRQIHRR